MNLPTVDQAAIDQAVAVLRRGGLVAMPTETVYGLAADACNETAVRSIFAAKGRPTDHPLIVHLACTDDPAGALEHWGQHISDATRALVRAFWPGPLTVVVERSARVLDLVTGGQSTVALRCPSHPWAQALLTRFAEQSGGHALAAPSANRFGALSPTTAAHVWADLGQKPSGRVDLILDAGPCAVGIESTIVDCSCDPPRLLRPGMITEDQLTAVLGRAVLPADAHSPRVSGALPAHYAPHTPLELVDADRFSQRLSELGAQRVAVLAPSSVYLSTAPHWVMARVAPDNAEAYAHQLYALLHELDTSGAQRLLVVRPPQGASWAGLMDRLQRAAAGHQKAAGTSAAEGPPALHPYANHKK